MSATDYTMEDEERRPGEPLVSVVIPAYNHERYIGAAIESVLAQSLTDFELIIIDDCSSDATWDVICNFSDPRLRCWRHQENQGADQTLNEGLTNARGQYLAILNSDDLFEPQRLARCTELLAPDVAGLVGSDIQLIDHEGNIQKQHWWIDRFTQIKKVWQQSGRWPAALMAGNMFMTTSNFCFTRPFLAHAGAFEQWRYVPDYAFLLAGLAHGGQLFWVDEPLLRYRLHESNTISEKPLYANLEASALLRATLPKLVCLDDRPTVQHFLSQSALIERYLCEIKDALKHEALVEKDTGYGRMIADRDNWIAERDSWIAERDEVIRAQAEDISELKQTCSELSLQLNQIQMSRFYRIYTALSRFKRIFFR